MLGWREYLNDPASARAMIAKLNPALTPDGMQFTGKALRDAHFVAGDAPDGADLGQLDPKRWQIGTRNWST